MNKEEFLECEDREKTCELLTQTEIIELTSETEKESAEEEANDSETSERDLMEPKIISSKEAFDYIDQLKTFLVQSPYSDESDIQLIMQFFLKIERLKEKSKFQSKINRYLF